MNGRPIVLQDCVTIRNEASAAQMLIAQSVEKAVDVSSYKVVEVLVQGLFMTSGPTLRLETSPERDRTTWRQTLEYNVAGAATTFLRRELGLSTGFLENFLRWRINYTAGSAWQVCFRIVLVPRG